MLTPERRSQMGAVTQSSFTLTPQRRAQMDSVLGKTPQPQQGNGIGGFLRGLISPIEDAVRLGVGGVQTLNAAGRAFLRGGTPEALSKFNEEYQNSWLTPKQKQTFRNDKLGVDSSMLGAKVGAGVLPYVAPVGLSSGLISGAASGFSQTEGTNPEDYLQNIATGASSGLLFSGAGKLLSRGGELLNKSGKNYALRGLRPSPSQQRSFKEATGQAIEDFMSSNNLYGVGTDRVDEVIKPIQEAFDNLTANSDKKVAIKKVIDEFDKQIHKYSVGEAGYDPANRQIAEFLLGEKQQFMAKNGINLTNGSNFIMYNSDIPDEIGISSITKVRKSIDKNTPSKQFQPGEYGKQRALGNIYREVINSEVGSNEVGKKLNKLYKFREIADKQSGVGRGTQPISLPKLGSMTAGGIVGGFPGAAAGYVAEQVINNPKTTFLASKIAQKAGSGIQSTRVPTPISNVVRGTIATGAVKGVKDYTSQDKKTVTYNTFKKSKNNLKNATGIKLPTYQPLNLRSKYAK